MGTFGIAFKDFALLCTDSSEKYSILIQKMDSDKIIKLSETLMMSVTGETGDTDEFADFIAKNIHLFRIRNGFELSPSCAANFIQRNLADYLRSRKPRQCNILLAGYDKENGPELYFIDYLATLLKVPFAAHGYVSYLVLTVIDSLYRPDMSVEEGVSLVKKCVTELHRRFLLNLPAFTLKICDKDGVRSLDNILIDAKSLGLTTKPF